MLPGEHREDCRLDRLEGDAEGGGGGGAPTPAALASAAAFAAAAAAATVGRRRGRGQEPQLRLRHLQAVLLASLPLDGERRGGVPLDGERQQGRREAAQARRVPPRDGLPRGRERAARVARAGRHAGQGRVDHLAVGGELLGGGGGGGREGDRGRGAVGVGDGRGSCGSSSGGGDGASVGSAPDEGPLDVGEADGRAVKDLPAPAGELLGGQRGRRRRSRRGGSGSGGSGGNERRRRPARGPPPVPRLGPGELGVPGVPSRAEVEQRVAHVRREVDRRGFRVPVQGVVVGSGLRAAFLPLLGRGGLCSRRRRRRRRRGPLPGRLVLAPQQLKVGVEGRQGRARVLPLRRRVDLLAQEDLGRQRLLAAAALAPAKGALGVFGAGVGAGAVLLLLLHAAVAATSFT